MQIADYISNLPEVFGEYWDGWDNFEAYVAHIRQDTSWGDQLTLMAAAHLLMRPISVITDSLHEASGLIQVEPPEIISREVWGEPIVLIHHAEFHYEATAKND